MQTDLTVPQKPPRVISRAEHPISRRNIAPEALHVLQRLHKLNYKAYLVGGAVRDLYLEKEPKDYDVGTDAKPSRLKKIFRHCRIIGRRFRIAHVRFRNGNIVEVATFRQDSPRIERADSGVIVRDNEFGTPQQDATRRDLTINGLFYDIATFSVIDYVGGVEDLQEGIIRTISEPNASFREDPVRMIRALRHGARTSFEIEEKTLEAIHENSKDITLANPARLLEELLKDLRSGAAYPFFQGMLETNLLGHLCPPLAQQLLKTGEKHAFWERMKVLDKHTSNGEIFSNAVLLGLFLQTVLLSEPSLWDSSAEQPPDMWREVQREFREMDRGFRISRRDTERITQFLMGVRKLEHGWKHRRLAPSLRRKSYLTDALEFFLIELEARGQPTDLVESWRRKNQAHAPPDPRKTAPPEGQTARKRRRPRRRRRRRQADSET